MNSNPASPPVPPSSVAVSRQISTECVVPHDADHARAGCGQAHEKAYQPCGRVYAGVPGGDAGVPSYAAQMKGKTGVRRIINALGYSWDGILAACDEAGFRQLLWLNGGLLLLALLLPFSLAVQLALILGSCFSLVVELINTGIEAAVDHTSLAEHQLAKRAKDVGSAAQYLTLLVLLLMWLLALWRTFG